jgi:hypothetical protein
LFATHELAANDLASEELRRLVVEHLGDFFSDTAEGFRIVSDFRGLDHFLFDRQILRPALSALVLLRTFGHWLQTFDVEASLRLFSGGVGFSQCILFQEQFQLSRIELLALGAEEAPDEYIDLFLQQLDLLTHLLLSGFQISDPLIFLPDNLQECNFL